MGDYILSHITPTDCIFSHEHLHRGNRVSEYNTGSCLLRAQRHHNNLINATDYGPGDINLEEDHIDHYEAI